MEPGIYDEKRNLIKSWEELKKNKNIIITDGVLKKSLVKGIEFVLSDEVVSIDTNGLLNAVLEKIYINKNCMQMNEEIFDELRKREK